MRLYYRIFSGEDGSLVAEEVTVTRSRSSAISTMKGWTRYEMGDRIILEDSRRVFYDTSQPFRSLFRHPKI